MFQLMMTLEPKGLWAEMAQETLDNVVIIQREQNHYADHHGNFTWCGIQIRKARKSKLDLIVNCPKCLEMKAKYEKDAQ